MNNLNDLESVLIKRGFFTDLGIYLMFDKVLSSSAN